MLDLEVRETAFGYGVTPAMRESILDALRDNELIRVKVGTYDCYMRVVVSSVGSSINYTVGQESCALTFQLTEVLP